MKVLCRFKFYRQNSVVYVFLSMLGGVNAKMNGAKYRHNLKGNLYGLQNITDLDRRLNLHKGTQQF